MADIKDDVTRELRKLMDSRVTVTIIPATVNAVDESALTCDVTDADGNEIYDVRLRAAIDGSIQGHVIIPQTGSTVLVANIGNSPNEHFIAGFSGVKKLIVQIDSTRFQVDTSGILLQRGEMTLKQALNMLIDQIVAITVPVTTAPGTSGPPVNAAAITAIKNTIDTVLN